MRAVKMNGLRHIASRISWNNFNVKSSS